MKSPILTYFVLFLFQIAATLVFPYFITQKIFLVQIVLFMLLIMRDYQISFLFSFFLSVLSIHSTAQVFSLLFLHLFLIFFQRFLESAITPTKHILLLIFIIITSIADLKFASINLILKEIFVNFLVYCGFLIYFYIQNHRIGRKLNLN